MDERKIIITRPLQADPVGMLRSEGFGDVWISDVDETLPRDQLLERIRGAHAAITLPGDRDIDAEVFDAAGEQLVIVSNYAVGTDNIDVAEAKRRGIIIGHTPNAVTEPTADIAWLLLLGAARRAYEGERLVRSGAWSGIGPNMLLGRRIVGKTLLIVGAGRIGRAVVRRALGWNMRVLYHARTRHIEFEEPPLNAPLVALEEGLIEADFISLHTPLTDETRHLIDARRLDLMKSTAILINTARGAVVDEAALVDALRERRIAAAGLDVYEHEPKLHQGLADLDNVFLMPHLGSATHEDREWMTEIVVNNVIAALRGETPPHVVA
jgi:glyoxylate reductase